MKKALLILVWAFSTTTAIKAQYGQEVNKPVQNFEAFWNLFDKNYAFFEEKNINWDSIGRMYRPTITENTNNEQLFSTFCAMIKPMNDSHVKLINKKADTTFSASRPSRILEALTTYKGNPRMGLEAMVDATLTKNGFSPLQTQGKVWRGYTMFRYGNNGKVGYLRVGRCFSRLLLKMGPRLNKQLNTMFKSFQGLDALIIDIRLNPGGTDAFSEKIAGRLTDQKVAAYYKQTRKKGAFEPIKTYYNRPQGESKFVKPVYLLTNDKSVSAADVLALMLESLENVTIVGENSNGSYSDIYAKKIPNKWTVTLSNQRYLSLTNKNYEGIGTPVDIEVKNMLKNYNDKDDAILNEVFQRIGQ